MCAQALLHLLEKTLTLSLSGISDGHDPRDRARRRDQLIDDFQSQLNRFEQDFRRDIKERFLHNLFYADLASETLAARDLFSEETWQVLGLTQKQLSLAFATLGATAGLALDGATAGIAFGLFTVGGGAAGAIAGWTGTRPLSRLKVEFGPFSRELGGCRIKVGPLRNPQLMFVLLDRALIYFQCVSNWAHARRDDASISLQDGKMGWTSGWDRDRRRAFEKYQAYLQKGYLAKAEELQPVLRQILIQVMREELNQDIGQP